MIASGLSEDDAWAEMVEKYKEALVIDENGVNLGILSMGAAYLKAKERNVMIVKVRDSEPPVLRFEERLTGREAREKAKKLKKLGGADPDSLHERMKEVRLSDKITEHDLQVKVMKTTQHLLSRYRVKVLLSFKKKAEFDPQVAKVLLDNVLLRLADICIIETSPKMTDDRACFVVIRPVSRRQLIQMGAIEAPSKEAEKEPSRREIIAEKHRIRELEKQELREQGLVFKRYLSPAEQTRLAQEAAGKNPGEEDIIRESVARRTAGGKRIPTPADQEDEFMLDEEEEDLDLFEKEGVGIPGIGIGEDEDELILPGRR